MKLSALSLSERLFNAAALISLAASVAMWFLGSREEALFIGLWVPSIIGWMNFSKLKEQDVLTREVRAAREGGR